MRRSLLAIAILFAATLAARADTTITFSGLPATGFPPLTTYLEGGFTVTNVAGQFYTGDNFGNPEPDLFTIYDTSTVAVAAIGGSTFTFQNVDFANEQSANQAAYTITGTLNGTQVFSTTGQVGGFLTFSSYGVGNRGAIDALRITVAANQAVGDLDNIRLGSVITPEPSSFALLGTGLLGIAGLVRKRFA